MPHKKTTSEIDDLGAELLVLSLSVIARHPRSKKRVVAILQNAKVRIKQVGQPAALRESIAKIRRIK